jgi:hypothetical protein
LAAGIAKETKLTPAVKAEAVIPLHDRAATGASWRQGEIQNLFCGPSCRIDRNPHPALVRHTRQRHKPR